MKKIPPTILKGTRDFLPAEMARRNFVMDLLRGIFERFGYAPIETPILSPAETILGKYGEEGDRLTYSFEDNGERRVALPYDLTVPFARFFAEHARELPLPFKRYQIQRVWRAEKPQKGRLREFYQCDIDTIGTKSLVAEAEIARVVSEVFTALDIPFVIQVNSRRVMNAALAAFDVPEASRVPVIRALDKFDKVGKEGVVEALAAAGIADGAGLIEALAPMGGTPATLEKLAPYDGAELTEFLSLASAMGVPADRIAVNPLLARGLDYYTGIIFEVVSPEAGFGTICAGGRYDDLVSLFDAPAGDFSGVGVAFGFERIMLILEERGALRDVATAPQALVAIFDEATRDAAVGFYDRLIAAGGRAEIYFDAVKLEKQFKYADKKGIPFVLIVGPDEAAAGTVAVKDMRTGRQEIMPQAATPSFLAGRS